jgi:methanogenic corrinoid protein MtbC1/DNA-binding XRE family transcriptional regulator
MSDIIDSSVSGGTVAGERDELHRRYLDALVGGDAERAEAIVEQARTQGWSVEQIYLHVLAPAQSEIGARWRARRLSVADEHLATEITLSQMGRLRERIAPNLQRGRHVVVACVEGEGHAIAARMLADFLLIDGWGVDYLGASTPTSDLVALVARRHPDLVALSITQPAHLPAATAVATALRRLSPTPALLAGGAALRGRPRGAASLGVDAVAADALSGMHEARRLIAGAPSTEATGEDYFQRLGRHVQELRVGKGWTQQQLAEAAGLDRTYISGLEHGKQNPTVGALLRLGRALEVPLDRLVIIGAVTAGGPPMASPAGIPAGAGTIRRRGRRPGSPPTSAKRT